MTETTRRGLLAGLCAVGIPALLIGSLVWGPLNPKARPEGYLRLNEIMNNNVSCLAAPDGKYYDWVEICNTGNTAVSLNGMTLSDDPEQPDAFVFGDTVLAPQTCVVVYLTGEDGESREGYASFALGGSGDSVSLYSARGAVLDTITVRESPENVSYGYAEEQAVWFASPTPGAANTGISAATPEALAEACYTGILIGEVCAVSRSSDTTTPYDWVELYNTTATPIDLAGYRLTEDITVPGLVFPTTVLGAGERLVVPCEEDGVDGALYAPFSLNRYGETLTLLTPSGVVCDRFETGKQRYGVTSGRQGADRNSRVYFESPSPGTENGVGLPGYAAAPTADREGGYVAAGTKVTFTVPTGCRVFYSTNGSEPTNLSTEYVAGTALTVASDTVLRAVAYREGYLPSDVVTQTYLTGEPHDLPVVSVSGDPAALNHTFADFLDEENEVAVHTEYFNENGDKAVTFDSLLRIAGGLSRYNVQKGFSLNLNQTVGKTTVTYPFFKDSSVTEFHNLLMRPSGSDWSNAKLRDEFTAQALKGQDGLVIQSAQPVALYLNGKYHGLYYLREKRNEEFIEDNTGIPAERVEIAKQPAVFESPKEMNADLAALIQYARTHDLTQAEHYRYVTERINEQSLMRYFAVQTWFGNGDMINNVACYRDKNGGEWHWILFDLDWACTSYYANSEFLAQLYYGTGQNTFRNYYYPLLTALLKNEAFRREFLVTYKQMMASTLSAERLLPILDTLAAEIESEIPRQYARFGAPSVARWNQQIRYMRGFIEGRSENITRQLCEVFALTDAEWAALG